MTKKKSEDSKTVTSSNTSANIPSTIERHVCAETMQTIDSPEQVIISEITISNTE